VTRRRLAWLLSWVLVAFLGVHSGGAQDRAHGDLTYLANPSGAVAGSQGLDPYGTVTGAAGVTPPVGFQSAYADAGTGNVWMNARWYDPSSGVFLSRDTMAGAATAPLTLNRFAYGNDNPTSNADPSGHCAMTATGWGDCSVDNGPRSFYVSSVVGIDINPNTLPVATAPPAGSGSGIGGGDYCSASSDPDPEVRSLAAFGCAQQRINSALAQVADGLQPLADGVAGLLTVRGAGRASVDAVEGLVNAGPALVNAAGQVVDTAMSGYLDLYRAASGSAVPAHVSFLEDHAHVPTLGYTFNDPTSRGAGQLTTFLGSFVGPAAIGRITKTAAELKTLTTTLKATTDSRIAAAAVDTAAAEGASSGAGLGLSSAETSALEQGTSIFGSDELGALRAAHTAGRSAEVQVGGVNIVYEPGLNASGMTLFGERGFVLGREAFGSNDELAKTVLHELYRLGTSESASGLSAGLASVETKSAAQFANEYSWVLTGGG
jgi:RHS repeat-associated protein